MEIKTLYSEKEIKRRVNELGGQLTKDYKGKRPIVVGILKGSVIFLSDLVRAMDTELELDFMAVSSYGDERKSSGAVNIDKDLSRSIEGRHVLVVEDIVDSGLTLSYLLSFLKDRSPASLKLVTLLDKKAEERLKSSRITLLSNAIIYLLWVTDLTTRSFIETFRILDMSKNKTVKINLIQGLL